MDDAAQDKVLSFRPSFAETDSLTLMTAFDHSLLKLMRCPITHSGLQLMPEEQLIALNRRLSEGQLKSRNGQAIELDQIESAVLNEEGSFAFSIQNGIVKLIADEAIDLTSN